jgi:plasmid stabilization system protein ParE
MTEFEVIFSTDADNDFEDILHFIAEDSPANAIAFVDRLERRIAGMLSTAPHAGKPVGTSRFVTFSGYVAVYNIDAALQRVSVLMVTEGHRDWQRLLETRS